MASEPTQHKPSNSEPIAAEVLDSRVSRTSAAHRLHPTSLLFDVLSHVRAYLIPMVFALFSAASGSWFFAAGFALFAFLPSTIGSVFRYITLRYCIREGELIVEQGLLFRRVRTVPVGRIQNIDLVQNILHRFFRVAEVRVETASGNEPEAVLRVLSLDDVAQLREEIFDSQNSGVAAAEQTGESVDVSVKDSGPDEDASETLLEMPLSWLFWAGLASNRGMLLLGIIFGLTWQFDLWESIDVEQLWEENVRPADTTSAAIYTVLGVVAVLLFLRLLGIVWYVLRFHDYRLSRHGEDLRISCGLFTTVSATIPRRRIQFISVQRTLFLKWLGFASIRIETAGGSNSQSESAATSVSRRWFVPVIPQTEVAKLVAELREGLDWDNAFDWQPLSSRAFLRLSRLTVMMCIALTGVGLGVTRPWGWLLGVAALPPLLYFARRKSRSMRYARFAEGVIFRSGILTQKMSVTFFDKVQNVRVDQSPFDRRWQMATLSVDTAAAGPADHVIKIPLLAEDFAEREQRLLIAAIR